MLVISPKRLVPVQINTTVLQGDDGNYYYLHRDLYDQLTILWDAYGYGAQMNLMLQILYGDSVKEFPENVQRFYDAVPDPLKAAAPFLMMVQGVEQLTTMEDMCGALTVISMSIHLRRVMKVDKSIRAAVTFSLHIREEYRTHWDRFFQENPEFGTAVTLPPPPPTVTQIATPEGGMVVRDEETGEEEAVTFTTPPSEINFDFMNDLMDVFSGSSDDAAEPAPAASSAPVAGASKPAPAVKSGFDALDGI